VTVQLITVTVLLPLLLLTMMMLMTPLCCTLYLSPHPTLLLLPLLP